MSAHPTTEARKKVSLWVAVLLFVGGVFTFYVFTLVIRDNRPEVTYDQTRALERAKILAETKAKNDDILEKYGVIDAAAGHYQIPLSKALDLTVQELAQKPVQASGTAVPKPLPVSLVIPPVSEAPK